MPAPELLTYADLIDRLRVYSQGGAGDAQQADFRHAIQSAYRELTFVREWRYFQSRGRITLAAPYSTGTIVYDHTGGAYERLVTLTTGTWPTWARYGRLLIDTDLYEVAERLSGTQLTLRADSNPGADVASTSYTIYRNSYTLPGDMVSVTKFQGDNGNWELLRVPPHELTELEKRSQASGTPVYYCIFGSPDVLASFAITFWPYPNAAENIDFLYRRRPRVMRYTGYGTAERQGTVAGTATGTSITGTTTAFTSAMIGSVIRFGDATNAPEGLGGLHPYVEQKVITAVDDETTLTVDTPLLNTYSAVKYTISDPVDIDPVLIEPLFACAQKHLASFRKPERSGAATAIYQQALIQAMEQDSRFSEDWPADIWWHDPFSGTNVASVV
jgi:hypothetical protein